MQKKISGFILIVALFVLAAGPLAAQDNDAKIQEEIVNLINKVRKNLLMLTEYGPFDYITFSLARSEKGYTVILKGFASRPSLKDAAEKTVQRVDRVANVDNQIEVLPVSPSDEEIRMEAYVKIYGNQSLSRYNPGRGVPIYGRDVARASLFGISQNPPVGFHPISIIVKNGHLTLEGVVDSEFDKNLASTVAGQVKFAFSVTNNLVVPDLGK